MTKLEVINSFVGKPSQVCNGVCMSRSQNLTVVSPDPLASLRLSGLNCTDITASAWPGNELKTFYGDLQKYNNNYLCRHILHFIQTLT